MLLVLLFALVAAPARADCDDIRWEIKWQPDPFGTTGGQLIRVPVCRSTDGSKPKAEARKKKKPKEPTKAQYRALRFKPSEAVSAAVRGRMIDQLAHGEQADQIRALIDSGDLMRQFNASMGTIGWSARDYADMYANAYIQLWLAANGESRTSSATDKAVRAQLRRQFALDAKVRRASDAVQQENAEYLGSWVVVLIGSINHVRAQGDAAAVEALRENLRERVDSADLLDVDLTEVELTRRGIERG